MTTSQISSLARQIAESDPANAHEQRQILWRLKDVRDKLEPSVAHEDQAYLDAAITLVNYVVEMGHIGGIEILEVAARVLSSMQPESGEAAGGKGTTPDPPGARPTPVKLKMREGEPPHLRLATEGPPGPRKAPAAKARQRPTAEEPPGLRPSTPAKGSDGILTRLIGDLLLGEVMIRLHFVTPEQVERALRIQRASGVRFGEALVQSGAASWRQVEQALRYQVKHRSKPAGAMGAEIGTQDESLPKGIPLNSSTSRAALPPVVDHLDVLSGVLLGQILVQNGIVTMYELQLGLRYQKKHGGRIGEALIAVGVATQRDINFGLRVQARMRHSA